MKTSDLLRNAATKAAAAKAYAEAGHHEDAERCRLAAIELIRQALDALSAAA